MLLVQSLSMHLSIFLFLVPQTFLRHFNSRFEAQDCEPEQVKYWSARAILRRAQSKASLSLLIRVISSISVQHKTGIMKEEEHKMNRKVHLRSPRVPKYWPPKRWIYALVFPFYIREGGTEMNLGNYGLISKSFWNLHNAKSVWQCIQFIKTSRKPSI